ncbi:MAG: 3-deoxy-D-manno-octulosonic acid transferase [Bacteroidales bacterium]|nr:3-deoxy-D-manno-octulosonic acid transferase [Bacteroidales bacterium]MCF8405390.1 3-deoxy-D-manno-octulosonic acid transferase [Bacteroidales bacterium]
MSLFYNLAIFIYSISIKIASLFLPKAALWVKGRKDILKEIANTIDKNNEVVWFHAASLGEFEQGRPVIEAFKKQKPDIKIVLTFFSPSGYEVRKGYKGADYIFYLPIDTHKNAKQFIRIVKPQLAVFIKYEFWFNYLKLLHAANIPTYIISANFRENQHFFKWYGGWFRKGLKKITWFFVQNNNSASLLKSIGIKNITVSGDTRFDRVSEIALNPRAFPIIEAFKGQNQLFLAGSTWPEDEKLLVELIAQIQFDVKLVIAPHEIHESHLVNIEKSFSSFRTIRLTKADHEDISAFDVLIIDGIGFLSNLYQYCKVAYIGGGFGKGIHNILEAVAFGKPVIFGPNFKKFAEAVELIDTGGAFHVNNSSECIQFLNKLLSDPSHFNHAEKACFKYIDEKKGATQKVLDKIL